jgi:hypothetical protein
MYVFTVKSTYCRLDLGQILSTYFYCPYTHINRAPRTFFAPPRGDFTDNIIQKNHTRTLAAVAPAEAGSTGSTVPAVWKEETVVFVRDRVWVERTALGIVGGQNEAVKAVQDEASPTPLPGEPPKAKNLLLGEGQSHRFFTKLEHAFCKNIDNALPLVFAPPPL